MASAAVIQQKIAQLLDQSGVWAVDQVSALTLDGDELRLAELFQVKTQGGVGDAQFFDQLPGGEAPIPTLNDEPEDVESGFLAQRKECNGGLMVIHISNFIETL